MDVLKDEVDIDVDQLLKENLHYKRIHKTLSTQIQFIENKMKELKVEVSNLYSEQMQTQANENFLKKIIKALSKSFGYENIAKVIELNADDVKEAALPKGLPDQTTRRENSGALGVEEGSLFELSESSYNEDEGYPENGCPDPLDYEVSEQFSGNDIEQPYEKYRVIYPYGNPLAPQGQLQDLNLNNIISSLEYQAPMVDPNRSTNAQTYRNWVKEYEKKSMELPQLNLHRASEIENQFNADF